MYPNLRFLFPSAGIAYAFAEGVQALLFPDMTIDISGGGRIVEISGADASHPELRWDLINAAKSVGGDEMPSSPKH